MKSAFIYLSLLIFLSVLTVKAETYTSPDGHQFAVNLRFPKTSIMLGEPAYFDYEIENLSKVDLGAVFGGDYRNQFGRPDSFEVKIIAAKGNVLLKPKTMTMGGLTAAIKIPVGQKYEFRLYLPHWGAIEKLGDYKIQLERTQIIAKYDEKDRAGIINSENIVPIKLDAEIEIVPQNYQKFGKIIDEIGKNLVAQDDTAQRLAPFIFDRRIIKYLAEAVEKTIWLMRHLAKFNDTTAFKAIISKINDVDNEVRRNVSISLSLSVYPQAAKYLLKMRTDKYHAIRLDVVHYLGKIKTKESSKLLAKMVNDENEWVRNEAKRYLTERGEKSN